MQPLAGPAWDQDGSHAREPEESQPQGRHDPYLSVVFSASMNKHVVTQSLGILFTIGILLTILYLLLFMAYIFNLSLVVGIFLYQLKQSVYCVPSVSNKNRTLILKN